jgi:hypothetical protein
MFAGVSLVLLFICPCGTQVTFEESKEANSATGQATHRVSRGLHNKVFFCSILELMIVLIFLPSTFCIFDV